MVTLQFVSYNDIEDLGSARRVKKLIDIVKENKIVLLQGRLKKEEVKEVDEIVEEKQTELGNQVSEDNQQENT